MESWGDDKKKFLGELFAVLGKILPKRNSFALIGESNSGKSLLMRSLIHVFDNIIGEVHQSCANQFSFQDCVAKNLILAEEFVVGEELQDQIKLLMEGTCCKVAVKCKADGYVERTPFLITSNRDITCWLKGEDKVAINNRQFSYRTKSTPQLKEVIKPLNPAMWYELHVWYENCVFMDYLSVENENGFPDEDDDLFIQHQDSPASPQPSTSKDPDFCTPTTSTITVTTPQAPKRANSSA
jgi:hypothetical protein